MQSYEMLILVAAIIGAVVFITWIAGDAAEVRVEKEWREREARRKERFK